jgi:hypothetical protein
VLGYEIVSSDRLFAAGTRSFFGGVTAACPVGKHVLGGGSAVLIEPSPGSPGLREGSSSGVVAIASRPTAGGAGWNVCFDAQVSGSVRGVRVFAVCATTA